MIKINGPIQNISPSTVQKQNLQAKTAEYPADIFTRSTLSEEKTYEKFSSPNWKPINPRILSIFTHTIGGVYSTPNGAKLKVQNPLEAKVFFNAKTGEISVTGAKNAEIDAGENPIINLYNTSAKKIKVQGNDGTIFISNSTVKDIQGKADVLTVHSPAPNFCTVLENLQPKEPKKNYKNPEASTCGRFAANIHNLEPKNIEEILNADIFSKEEKEQLQKLYQNLCAAGGKEFLESHVQVFQNMAYSTFCADSTRLNYGNLDEAGLSVIRQAIEQFDCGLIKPEWSKAAEARMKDSVPYFLFGKYWNDYDLIPHEGVKHPNYPSIYFEREDIIRTLEESKDLQEFLETQSLKEKLNVIRTDSAAVFQNFEIKGQNIGQLLKNGEKEKAVSLLNLQDEKIELKYDNFIGTKLNLNEEEENQGGILWDLELPVGTKCAFLTGITPNERMYHEGEILLQTGTSFEIKNAEMKNGTLYIKARAVQN